jgi:hypothetical protein
MSEPTTGYPGDLEGAWAGDGSAVLTTGGVIASRSSDGSSLPDIGATTDAMVADDAAWPTDADGYPMSPTVARRYSAAAAQGYRGDNTDPGAPR